MHPDLEKLVRLQEVELEIRNYNERIDLLPKQLAALETKLQNTLQRQQSLKEHFTKLASEKKKLEVSIQDVEQKISKYKGQLFEVKTNDQYRALLNEIEFSSQEIRKFEDEILVRMEQEEKLKAEGKAIEIRLQQEKAVVETEKKAAEAEVVKELALLVQFEQERKTLIEEVPADLYRQYTRIASFRKGVALARAAQETCLGCNVRIRPQIFSEVMKGEVIHTCDSCSRLLYYKPEIPYEVTEPSAEA